MRERERESKLFAEQPCAESPPDDEGGRGEKEREINGCVPTRRKAPCQTSCVRRVGIGERGIRSCEES